MTTACTEPGMALWSNSGVDLTPLACGLASLLLQPALSGAFLPSISKQQASIHNAHGRAYCTEESTLKCKNVQLRIIKSALTGFHQTAAAFHSSHAALTRSN